MATFYYLSSCGTCRRIQKELELGPEVELVEIKSQGMTPEQVDEMKELAGSYEALFSRRAKKYKEWGLAEQELTEADFRRYLLEEYTFLKRPVLVLGEKIFVGNAKATVLAAQAALQGT